MAVVRMMMRVSRKAKLEVELVVVVVAVVGGYVIPPPPQSTEVSRMLIGWWNGMMLIVISCRAESRPVEVTGEGPARAVFILLNALVPTVWILHI